MATTHVIIHGHFYQPPRENPWTGTIELQESAAPYRDWNQRITAECYTPNTRSRVLDGQGRVLEVANNFERISFNFGPTLMSYLEQHHPETYRRVLEGDQACIRRTGFGNAMAQAYNHMIMPLAGPRDRWTQILWGMSDFRARFKRDPLGMWLPETAVNLDTLADLVRAGIRFVLLAPSQAAAIRPAGTGEWREVSAGDIPTDRPYLCRTPDGDISILFYHAGLSTGVAFEHLLRNAGHFADRIAEAARQSDLDQRLVLVASDGESYGHHEPMGDMCFAYLSTRELPNRGMKLVTPAEFLSEHAPGFEVKLKPGEDGKGTAWSCAHGVGRWERDCGCATGGPASWNQGWRSPLRKAFDSLKVRVDELFESEGGKYLKDPWAARDDYVRVIQGVPLGAAKAFLDQHSAGELSDDERGQVYRLMEMQRNAMLMYTSCAWFFSDLSGIETVQNMKYACRCAQLAGMLAGEPQDREMMAALAKAKSNLSRLGSGVEIIDRFVRPAALSPEKVAAHHAVMAIVEPLSPTDRIYHFRIQAHNQKTEHLNGFDAYCGRLTVFTDRTREGGTFDAAVISGSDLRLLTFVRPFDEKNEAVEPADLLESVQKRGYKETCGHFQAIFGLSFSLSDMLQELKLKAVGVLLGPLLEDLAETFERIFKKNEKLLYSLSPLGISLPNELKGPAAYAGSRRFNRLVERYLGEDQLGRAFELAELLESLEVPLDMRPASRLVGQRLTGLLEEILEDPDTRKIGTFVKLLDSARSTGLTLDEASLQDRMAAEFGEVLDKLLDAKRVGGPAKDDARALVALAGMLNLNTDRASEKLAEDKVSSTK